jgi:hypothetical protein
MLDSRRTQMAKKKKALKKAKKLSETKTLIHHEGIY